MSEVTASRIRGSLLAAAIGEALGAPGAPGSIEPGDLGGDLFRDGHLDASTQLCLYTLEALLICGVELERSGQCLPPARLEEAYRRWLDGAAPVGGAPDPSAPRGWLSSVRLAVRAVDPSSSCLAALRSSRGGRLSTRPNAASGTGGLARAAPAGFLVPGLPAGASSAEAYHLGCEVAVVTHGADVAVLTAGCLAAIICSLVAGEPLGRALEVAQSLTSTEIASLLDRSFELGSSGAPSPELLEDRFGTGRRADEALGIAVACAAGSRLPDAIAASASLPGASGPVSATCGALVGARDGVGSIPAAWLEGLEGRWLIDELADDALSWLRWLEDPSGQIELGERFLERYS
jgi:ADP-ribosylglycohydrolase